MDKYRNFQELKTFELEGQDFRVEIVSREGSQTAVIAPHGGKIEPGTSELALAIAGEDLNVALFEGIKPGKNRDLHLTSTNFDEPRCLKIVQGAENVLALHGERSAEKTVYLGGSDALLRQTLAVALEEAGFTVAEHQDITLQGTSPKNICNRGKRCKGVQLELSRGLRETFFQAMTAMGRKTPTDSCKLFVGAVRAGLQHGGAF